MNPVSEPGKSKRTFWAVTLISILVALPFVMSASMKLMLAPAAVEGFTKANIPVGTLRPLGIIELSCLVLFLVPRTTVLGAFLLTGYLGGATLANIIMRSDFFHALAIGLLVWIGVWLRVPELRALFPLRNYFRATSTREG
jgi:DoxX-like family